MSITRCVFWGLLVLISGCKFNASCGNSDNILNTRKGEKVISEWLEKQGMSATDIDCPRDIKIEQDMKFMCKAVMKNSDNLTLDIEITQTSDDGDINMAHGSKIQPASLVERGLAGQILDQTGKKVTVDCGFRVRLAVPQSTFTCEVTSEAEKFQVGITITDDTGAWQAKKL
jgi:hypothetical protein